MPYRLISFFIDSRLRFSHEIAFQCNHTNEFFSHLRLYYHYNRLKIITD